MQNNSILTISDFQLGLALIEKNILCSDVLNRELLELEDGVSLREHLLAKALITPEALNPFTSLIEDETLLLQTVHSELSGFNENELKAMKKGMTLETAERFEFIKALGKGGMGEVVEVKDAVLQRRVAIKKVRVDKMNHENHEKLLIEAQITGILEHPSIVPIYDLCNDEDGKPFYVMRIVEEESLKNILNQLRQGNEVQYSLTQLISILRQVALAIQFAHHAGVIHRDLKPDNILIGKYGEVYIIDWGVALILNDERDENTTEYSIVGTPTYLAPEQARGDSNKADFRTDIYALGVLLYEILCLHPPFRTDCLHSLLFNIVFEAPILPSLRSERLVPKELEQIAMRALKKEPNQRFQMAEEFAEELEFFLEGIKEKEKKRKARDRSIREGTVLETQYREAKTEKTYLQEKATSFKAARNLADEYWTVIERIEFLSNESQRLFSAAIHQYSQTLVNAPGDKVATEKLGALYWERFRDSERAGDLADAAFFESLVRQYNDGRYDHLLKGLGTLELKGDLKRYEISIEQYIQQNGVLSTSKSRKISSTTTSLLHGSYLLQVKNPTKEIRIPVMIERNRVSQINVPDLDALNVPDDFVYVNAGEFLMWSGKDEQVHEDSFAIQKYPVTVEQYLEFINENQADYHLPTSKDAGYFVLKNGKYVLPNSDAQGDRWSPSWPIISINYADAQAYAEWLSERDGIKYELPTLNQWMKAARGVDGRSFPWGRHFSPDFCQMRDTNMETSTPSPVGEKSVDQSPYGCFDMCGNIAEWTKSLEPGTQRRYLGGASYNSFEELCNLNFVFSSNESYKFGHYGFRLVVNHS